MAKDNVKVREKSVAIIIANGPDVEIGLKGQILFLDRLNVDFLFVHA